jgi:hypothetical protein
MKGRREGTARPREGGQTAEDGADRGGLGGGV